ncbi:heterokaryon incompatibility protein-domain-containing protein [Hypoxylon cercidicola]|nr:heterokaryon incompatibility protein-domain-containing protein [Hypoxylon cercidicola]
MISHLEMLIKVILEPEQMAFPENVAGSIIRSESLERGFKSWLPEHDQVRNPIHGLVDKLHIRGRMVPAILNSDLLEDWIHYCDTHHKECLPLVEQRRAFTTRSTIRLIDVEERMIILTTQQEHPYVALSYVWGEATKGSLTAATVERFSTSHGLPDDPSIIPQTILDAIRLVRNIGFRYLWVDTLCILQDDDDDKLRHLPHMDSIYSCANLVIIAAAGNDAHAGLPGVVRSRTAWQSSENVDGFPLITVEPPLLEVLGRTRWNSRGWTFQEAILARRVLVVTERQVYWNCHEDCWREDMVCQTMVATVEKDDRNSLWAQTPHQGSCPTRIYCHQVMHFSQRKFKEDGNVLWAFTGVLKLEASLFPKGYIWGLPYDILDAALLWVALHCSECRAVYMRRSRHIVHGKNGGLYRLRFPSWSWLSVATEVGFLRSCADDIVSKVLWQTPLLIGRDITPPKYLESAQKDCDDSFKYCPDQEDSVLFSDDIQNSGIMHYGLLRFSAKTAQLGIRRNVPDNRPTRDVGYLDTLEDVEVQNWLGEKMGVLSIVGSFFEGGKTRLGECVLLSANRQDRSDEHTTSHDPATIALSYIMDSQKIRSHRAKGLLGTAVISPITLGATAGLLAWTIRNDVDQRIPAPAVDWTDASASYTVIVPASVEEKLAVNAVGFEEASAGNVPAAE